MDDLGPLLISITERMSREKKRGRVADYIPELAKIDPNQFVISVALADGQALSAGDADTSFSIQSVSKVFALSLALTRRGADVWKRVGREPSGDPFNSIVQLEADHGIPRNPLINSGAIVISDIILAARDHVEAVDEVLNFMRNAADDDNIFVDPGSQTWVACRASSPLFPPPPSPPSPAQASLFFRVLPFALASFPPDDETAALLLPAPPDELLLLLLPKPPEFEFTFSTSEVDAIEPPSSSVLGSSSAPLSVTAPSALACCIRLLVTYYNSCLDRIFPVEGYRLL